MRSKALARVTHVVLRQDRHVDDGTPAALRRRAARASPSGAVHRARDGAGGRASRIRLRTALSAPVRRRGHRGRHRCARPATESKESIDGRRYRFGRPGWVAALHGEPLPARCRQRRRTTRSRSRWRRVRLARVRSRSPTRSGPARGAGRDVAGDGHRGVAAVRRPHGDGRGMSREAVGIANIAATRSPRDKRAEIAALQRDGARRRDGRRRNQRRAEPRAGRRVAVVRECGDADAMDGGRGRRSTTISRASPRRSPARGETLPRDPPEPRLGVRATTSSRYRWRPPAR